eukprot:Filipodium_phascolosomae@DN409_c0_g1_i1.p1
MPPSPVAVSPRNHSREGSTGTKSSAQTDMEDKTGVTEICTKTSGIVSSEFRGSQTARGSVHYEPTVMLLESSTDSPRIPAQMLKRAATTRLESSRSTRTTQAVQKIPVYKDRNNNDLDPVQCRMRYNLYQLLKKFPNFLEKRLVPFVPIIVRLGLIYNMIEPRFCASGGLLYNFYERWELYELMPFATGMIMAFFGGHYIAIIAAGEAFMAFGFDSVYPHLRSIYKDATRIWKKSGKKASMLHDSTGEEVKLTPVEITLHKGQMLLKTIDSAKVSSVVVGVMQGFMSVIATLQLQFAKAVTLGSSMADNLRKPLLYYVRPFFVELVPTEYDQWVDPLAMAIIKLAAVSIAWCLSRALSAVHSALRGGMMAANNLITVLHRRTYFFKKDDEETGESRLAE